MVLSSLALFLLVASVALPTTGLVRAADSSNAASTPATTLQLTARATSGSLQLPKALSDHTAVASADSAYIYILGGCDAKNGNVFDKSIGEFICGSISSSLYRFDVAAQTFETLQSMPAARYRHAAVMVDDRLWVSGGRDLDDYLIPSIDMYDPATDAWTVYNVSDKYRTSDHAGFARDGRAYFAGGYNYTYGFRDAVFAVDTRATLSAGNGRLVLEDKAPLLEARGDVAAAVNDAQTYAVIAGGFGPNRQFCAPAPGVEQYHFGRDAWSRIAPLKAPRSDMALVELNGNIIGMGGERQVENICEIDTPEPGEETLAVDDVEVLNLDSTSHTSEWVVLQDLPQNRFRLAAVAVDSDKAVYTFGGQQDFNSDCKCYRTTNQVVIYDAMVVPVDVAGGATSGAAPRLGAAPWAVAALALALLVGL